MSSERVVHARVPKEWVDPSAGVGSLTNVIIGVDKDNIAHVYRTTDSAETVCGEKPCVYGCSGNEILCEVCFLVYKGES